MQFGPLSMQFYAEVYAEVYVEVYAEVLQRSMQRLRFYAVDWCSRRGYGCFMQQLVPRTPLQISMQRFVHRLPYGYALMQWTVARARVMQKLGASRSGSSTKNLR